MSLAGTLTSTTHSLQRWCLKALHRSCDDMLTKARNMPAGIDKQPRHYRQHQGLPPLNLSCIAPHCQEWVETREGAGYCGYMLRHKALHTRHKAPANAEAMSRS